MIIIILRILYFQKIRYYFINKQNLTRYTMSICEQSEIKIFILILSKCKVRFQIVLLKEVSSISGEISELSSFIFRPYLDLNR